MGAPPIAAYDVDFIRGWISDMVVDGFGLSEIDQELIHPSGLPEDDQAALWLYAWCELSRHTR